MDPPGRDRRADPRPAGPTPLKFPSARGSSTEAVAPHKINGTSNDDQLVGTRNADLIHGYAGKDEIHPSGGADTVFAGRGIDTVDATGDHAADVVHGGPGRDSFEATNLDWPGGPYADKTTVARIYAKDGQRDHILCWNGLAKCIIKSKDANDVIKYH